MFNEDRKVWSIEPKSARDFMRLLSKDHNADICVAMTDIDDRKSFFDEETAKL